MNNTKKNSSILSALLPLGTLLFMLGNSLFVSHSIMIY